MVLEGQGVTVGTCVGTDGVYAGVCIWPVKIFDTWVGELLGFSKSGVGSLDTSSCIFDEKMLEFESKPRSTEGFASAICDPLLFGLDNLPGAELGMMLGTLLTDGTDLVLGFV